MRAFILSLILALLFLSSVSFGQTEHSISSRWSVNAGLGPAASFFVNSYVENQVPWEKSFFNKNPIGKHINIAIARKFNNWELSLGYSFEEFKKHIEFDTLMSQAQFRVDHSIHHTNHLFDLTFKRQFLKKNHLIGIGAGLYYLRPVQEEITIDYLANIILVEDRNYKNSYLEEAGALLDISYEYKFQPRVYVGIKSQFFFTISTGEAESLALFPFIKLLL